MSDDGIVTGARTVQGTREARILVDVPPGLVTPAWAATANIAVSISAMATAGSLNFVVIVIS